MRQHLPTLSLEETVVDSRHYSLLKSLSSPNPTLLQLQLLNLKAPPHLELLALSDAYLQQLDSLHSSAPLQYFPLLHRVLGQQFLEQCDITSGFPLEVM